jgi:Domain of unknown function (DUF5668)
MRIFPMVLIAVGGFALLRQAGIIEPGFMHLYWPWILIAVGIFLLVRGPRWRAHMDERMQERWERRMYRRFGPGLNNLSEEERERFFAGMRQWHSRKGCCDEKPASTTTGAPATTSSTDSGPQH